MPFKEIEIDAIIKEECKDSEFRSHYEGISREYDFIWKVVEARKEKGLTQKALAEQIGVSQQEISRFERQRHIPRLSSFLKIIDAIGLELKLVKKQTGLEIYSERINDTEDVNIYESKK